MLINQIYLEGYLTRDIEMKIAKSSGMKYICGSVNNGKWNKAEKKSTPRFFDFIYCGKDAETYVPIGKKGEIVFINGEFDISDYNGKKYHKIFANAFKVYARPEKEEAVKADTHQFQEAAEEYDF